MVDRERKPRSPGHGDIYDAILDVRSDVADLREQFIDLKGHVNDERDDMLALINQKVDKDDLLTSLGERVMRMRFVRWGFGVVAAATVSTVVVRNWLGPVISGDALKLIHALF